MLLSKRLWAVLLVGLLVAGLLVGFGDGDAAVAKEPRATLGKIMVPAAAFIPAYDFTNYANGGYFLATTPGTDGNFIAPLSFPVPEVYIRKIMLLAYDNLNASNLCVELVRAEPLKADRTDAGMLCTVKSTADPQKVALTALSPRRINTVSQGAYLNAYIDTGTYLYGVQVVYSY